MRARPRQSALSPIGAGTRAAAVPSVPTRMRLRRRFPCRGQRYFAASPVTGRLTKLLVAEGDTIAIDTTIVLVATDTAPDEPQAGVTAEVTTDGEATVGHVPSP